MKNLLAFLFSFYFMTVFYVGFRKWFKAMTKYDRNEAAGIVIGGMIIGLVLSELVFKIFLPSLR